MTSLEHMLDRLQRVSGRQVAILLALFIAATILLLVVGPGAQVQQLTRLPLPNWARTDLGELYPRFLEALRPPGRGAYLTFLVLDLAYAVLFALTFSAAIAAAVARYDKVPQNLRNLALVPLAGGACQFLTDLGLLILTLRSLSAPNALTTLTGWFSTAWLALVNITVVLAVVALFGLAHHGMRASGDNVTGK